MSIRVKIIAAPLAGLLAALLVSGCNSKNPDSLIGMNLDENAAMMDASEISDANTAAAMNANGNATSEQASSDHAAQSNPGAATSTRDEQSSATANAIETDNPPENESTSNQVENESEPPSDI